MVILPKIGSRWRIPSNLNYSNKDFLGLEFEVLENINTAAPYVICLIKILKVNEKSQLTVGEIRTFKFNFNKFKELKKTKLPEWF